MTPPTWSLDGAWQLRRTGTDDPWREIAVPGSWEDGGLPFTEPGPYTYRRTIEIPAETAGCRLWLRFEAVSYAARVTVDGHEIGAHLGAWDAFEVEITAHARPGATAELEVEVEKPASLTVGPDSEAVPGRFPMRGTLSGFLPYVWGHMFGGIWQGVSMIATGDTVMTDAHVAGTPDGNVQVEVDLSGPAGLTAVIEDPDGRVVARLESTVSAHHRLEAAVPDPRPWSPAEPALYTCRLVVSDRDERAVRFGLRRVSVDGTVIALNGQHVYPRLILSWGWYPDRLSPTPDEERVRGDLLALRRMGFNGVKLCLWFPPEHYFRIADELGMLLWLELPMWLPRPGPGFEDQVGVEYERLVRQARRHPSVILYTLGCELNADTAELLGPLYQRVKGLVGDALVRDNSGSGEAYGGRLDEYAEFHDHHFYADLPHLRGLLDHFAPRWRAPQPWLFGEFADSDAFRDPRTLADADGRLPWWTSPDPGRNPQGARWAMEITGLPATLDRSGDRTRQEELRRISEQASLLHRKHTLEMVRSVGEVSGYVLTGERDTPISTAGLWDDHGRERFRPDQLSAFNDDLVVLVGWGRRRAWVSGGDRPAPVDPWTYRSGDGVRAHLIESNFGTRGAVAISWSVAWLDAGGVIEVPFASGAEDGLADLSPGTIRELTIARFTAPEVEAPRGCQLQATITIGGATASDATASNAWPLWVFPRALWSGVDRVSIIDPHGRLDDLLPLLGERVVEQGAASVVVAAEWTPEVADFVERGGSAVLLQPDRSGPLPVEPLPFWREAIRIAEAHPAWADFPVEPFIGLQLLGASADHAFDTSDRPDRLPILWRLDARTGRTHDYAAELRHGRGRLIASTLRLDGRTGDLPLGISRSPGALHLLGCWVRYLSSS